MAEKCQICGKEIIGQKHAIWFIRPICGKCKAKESR